MKFIKTPNGNLKITADNDDRREIAEIIRARGSDAAEEYIADTVCCNSEWAFIRPEMIGALTDAPILAIAEWLDDAEGATPQAGQPVYWFEAYQIRDPWAELCRTGCVFFQGVAQS